MTDRPDGGQAFPHGNPTHGGDIGMTLRDWFAGMALQGIITTANSPIFFRGDLQGVQKKAAKTAYVIADAMLEERK